MRRTLPSKKVCEEFHLTYELKGAQKGVNILAKHYKIKGMKIVVDGRRVGNGNEACYNYENYTVYFTKRGFDKINVLHEFFHHLVAKGIIEIEDKFEEKAADMFAKKIIATAR